MFMRLYDGNNYFRRKLEGDGGVPLRNLIEEVELFPGLVIYAWDGQSANKRRRDIYPDYKSKREAPAEDFWKYQELFQACLLHTKAIQVRIPGYEGDDVIAAVVQNVDMPIHIMSNDKDLLALTGDNVTIDRGPVEGLEPGEIRLFKTCVGDSSDTITGIPGFGEKAWQKSSQWVRDDLMAIATGDWILSGEEVDAIMEKLGITRKPATWLKQHQAEFQAMWKVVGFFPPTWDDVNAHSVQGKSNPAAIDAILKEFMQ